MKLIFALVVLFVASACAKKGRKEMKECLEQNKLEFPKFKEALANPPLPKNVACTLGCMGIKKGLMKDDGSLVQEKIDGLIEKMKTNGPIIKKCTTDIKAGDPCANADKIYTCAKQNGFKMERPKKKKESGEE